MFEVLIYAGNYDTQSKNSSCKFSGMKVKFQTKISGHTDNLGLWNKSVKVMTAMN